MSDLSAVWNDLKSKFLSLTLTTTFTYDRIHSLFVNLNEKERSLGGEMRDAETVNLSCNIVSLQVLGRCFVFFTLELCDQLFEKQKRLLRVKETQRPDWLSCLSVSKFVA